VRRVEAEGFRPAPAKRTVPQGMGIIPPALRQYAGLTQRQSRSLPSCRSGVRFPQPAPMGCRTETLKAATGRSGAPPSHHRLRQDTRLSIGKMGVQVPLVGPSSSSSGPGAFDSSSASAKSDGVRIRAMPKPMPRKNGHQQSHSMMPSRSTAGQSTLNARIGVRIPGG
jgi:hypothetical protein